MIISERIFRIMESKNISQMDFSRATGISQSTISDWKRKKTNPSADKIMSICKVLGVTPYELLQDSAKRKNEKDYIIVSEGTDEYELVVEYSRLDTRDKGRLMGYLDALSDNRHT